MPDFTVELAIPLQKVFEKLVDAWTVGRETMSQENRDRWDKLIITQAENWHNWWVDQGWPGKKV